MNGLRDDGVVGLLGRIRRKNIFTQILFLAEVILDGIGIADFGLLGVYSL